MFKIITDLSMVLRKEWSLDTTGNSVLLSGVTGSWVTLTAGPKAILTTGKTGLAWPIWNESYRDGTFAFTPDVNQTKTISVIVGKMFATTDQYTGNPSQGQALTTAAGGKLQAATLSGTVDPVVAYCVQAPYSYLWWGQTINVIDIQTV